MFPSAAEILCIGVSLSPLVLTIINFGEGKREGKERREGGKRRSKENERGRLFLLDASGCEAESVF